MRSIADDPPIARSKPPVDPASLTWRAQPSEPFWQGLATWREVSPSEFLDWKWQERNAITSVADLRRLLGDRVSPEFVADVDAGLRASSMALRVPPYIASLIDWSAPRADHLRRQFVPLRSQPEPDHPFATFDHGEERVDSPTPGLTLRYFDRVLLLVTGVCPVYCRFCTRSYLVGSDTPVTTKQSFRRSSWEDGLRYIEHRPEVEDVVVSGGDTYRLGASDITAIVGRLLEISHVRRIRLATRGIAVEPMKVLTDHAWRDAVTTVCDRGRSMGKEVSLHTHFNHPREISWITQAAAAALFERGVPIRNLSVILRGVNDDPATQIELARRLAFMQIRPYYAYACDLVTSIEDLRTPLSRCLELEKAVRGSLTGHHTPTFVVDVPGGGGKRDVHSFEHYNSETGISIYTAPSVRPNQVFVYVDPTRELSPDVRRAWSSERHQEAMVADALRAAGYGRADLLPRPERRRCEHIDPHD